ncbi:N-acetylmuramoyl-L-alanine amidase [Streptomyces toyocaensis]|uniref:N-acetylmuramoyl-L-alanine amidase n=1 Tax=Streptomyces toyocaensis TaxID=55952 RepID=A0A081XIZ9_STRTO|nr:peptidoglycan recognition protein [Streptomyces toyocaensis]KES03522.1 N-acetylmuramoyl-L-alanine amidase [Streptomyces toyocaensis]
MRGILASSIGVTCAAALALPLAPPATAAAARPAPTAEAATRAAVTAQPDAPGSTQSLPLRPLTHDRVSGATLGLTPRTVRHFSLLGVIWDDAAAELHGSVQVRTRAAADGGWSDWQDVETHYTEHGADPGTSEAAPGRVRGATAPLWVGESDGVEVRVRPEPGEPGAGSEADDSGDDSPAAGSPGLPSGLRLELIDPGDAAAPLPAEAADARTSPLSAEATAASAANSSLVAPGATEIPALDAERTRQELLSLRGAELTEEQRAKPYIGPRPAIVTRRGWGANESLREKRFVYTSKVKAAFVHHTASGNNYTCAQAPSLVRGFYRYHVRSLGWRDIGYNFLVDKCGRIYEGRAGGVAKAVMGAHTMGFNSNTTGIAVIGSYGSKKPSSSAKKAVARLTAWKLGLHGMNPRAKTYLKSGGGNLYRKGKKVRLNVISGHRDGFNTSCPGGKLYKKLGTVRSTAARYQGR